MWAAMQKINFIPAMPSTILTLYFIPFVSCSGPTLSSTSLLTTPSLRELLINTWISFPWSVGHPLKMSVKCPLSYLVHALGSVYYVAAQERWHVVLCFWAPKPAQVGHHCACLVSCEACLPLIHVVLAIVPTTAYNSNNRLKKLKHISVKISFSLCETAREFKAQSKHQGRL